MKKLTRAITFATTALMSFGAIAQEQVELRFSWWGGSGRHSATLDAIRLFEEKHPNIKIRAEYSGWDGYLTKLTTQIAGGTEPDIMQLNWSWLDSFSSRGDGFYDLSTLKNLNLSSYSKANLEPTTRNNKLHAITTSMSGWVNFYNKNTWEKAGLDYPQTWDDLLAAGRTFKEKLGDDYYPLVIDPKETMLFLQAYMIQKYRQQLIDVDNKKLAYSDEQLEEMFELYRTLVANHVIPNRRALNAFGSGGNSTQRPWINGQWGSLYSPNPTGYDIESYLAEGQILEIGPQIKMAEAKEAGTFYRPAMVFSIAKETRHPEEAALFVDFIHHNPQAMDIVEEIRGIPFSSDAYMHLIKTGQIDQEGLNFEGFQILEANTYQTPISPYIEDDQLISEFQTVFENMDYNDWSAERAAREIRRRAERVLRRAIRS